MPKLSENLSASGDSALVRQEQEFSSQQRRVLLSIAHDAIAAGVTDKTPDLAVSSTGPELSSDWLMEPRGVFTTLYLGGELRGCVGYPMAIRPLHRAVAETARSAAFEDSRFYAVTPEEVGELKVSLSVLSPLFPIQADQVEVGRHGLMISDGLRRGLLLPQVPVEHGWDRETYLEQTCRKAGLPADAWQKSASLEAFTAEVFGDEDV